jgi:CheY-like chemotaxis protein
MLSYNSEDKEKRVSPIWGKERKVDGIMMVGLERKLSARPRLLLAYVDSIHAARTARFLRRHGWEVHLAASGAEVYHLIQEIQPRVVVLDTELHDESGWLISAKITLDPRSPHVILLAPQRTEADLNQLSQVGACALVARKDGFEALAEEVMGGRLAQAV